MMFQNISFEYPYILLLIVVFILCSIFCKAQAASYYIPHLKQLHQSQSKLNLLIPFLKYCVIVFALISLASPVKTSHTQPIKKDGINIVLSLDTSNSMKEIGFNEDNKEQNRWQAVAQIVKEFIDKRTNDNIGIVVFGNAVMTASPLSFDNRAQKEIIDYLDIGIVGDKTAMIDSLISSINILKNNPSTSNIIILLTDGEDNASQTPLNVVIRLAKKYNIKIYTINIARSNHNLLNKIATSTKAKFFTARSKSDLQKVYKEIDRIEKIKINGNTVILKEYYFFYTLFISLISLCFYLFLINKE